MIKRLLSIGMTGLMVAGYLGSTYVFAEEPDQVFFEANRHYAEGHFEEAAAAYEALTDQGVAGGALFYNLGNAYFKMGKKGRAILNYERSARYLPADEDLFYNLSYTRSLLEQAQPEESLFWAQRFFLAVRGWLSVGGWFILMLVLYMCLIAAAAAMILMPQQRKNGRWILGATGVLLVAAGFLFFQSVRSERKERPAVVVVPETEIRYSPSYGGAVAFKLQEGLKVKAVHRDGAGWLQVRLSRDKSGWAEPGAVEEI